MRIIFDLRKSVAENAAEHYEKAKKLKKKLPGMEKAIADTKRKLDELPEEVVQQEKIEKRRTRRWFEKYRWFKASTGHLVVGGRDATTNETLIKKHMQPADIVFHANIQGAPFFLIKNEGQQVTEETKNQAAQAAASYSKAWARGLGSVDVYEVAPEQVSKSPPAGEYLPKGAFMVYGEKSWHRKMQLSACIGIDDDVIIGGPEEAVRSHSSRYVVVGVGGIGQGKIAKKVAYLLGAGDLDEIQRHLPAGNSQVLKKVGL